MSTGHGACWGQPHRRAGGHPSQPLQKVTCVCVCVCGMHVFVCLAVCVGRSGQWVSPLGESGRSFYFSFCLSACLRPSVFTCVRCCVSVYSKIYCMYVLGANYAVPLLKAKSSTSLCGAFSQRSAWCRRWRLSHRPAVCLPHIAERSTLLLTVPLVNPWKNYTGSRLEPLYCPI